MKRQLFIPIGLMGLLFLSACQTAVTEIQTGIWRGVFETDSAIEIPFNFEIYDSAGTKQVAFINGKERLNINTVELKDDSVIIRTPMSETEIRAQLNSTGLSGSWIRNLPDRVQTMPFHASPNTSYRFIEDPKEAKGSITGRWSVLFLRADADTSIAIGDFHQEGNQVEGTFLTNYGDYRFLSGEIDGDTFYLSAYAGASPSLFVGKVNADGIVGDMYSGPANHSRWEAKADENAVLDDAYGMTRLKPEYNTLSFQFPDTEGDMVSLKDERFQNKVVVIQFLGSWCPNCMDETAFLSPFYKKYNNEGVEIIGLAYERYAEPARAKKAVKNLMDRFDVTYPVLLTGYSNKPGQVLESLPALENFNAFPTTIIIDKKGTVRTIHSGFDGPATGDAYRTYIKEFEATINQLLNE